MVSLYDECRTGEATTETRDQECHHGRASHRGGHQTTGKRVRPFVTKIENKLEKKKSFKKVFGILEQQFLT